jgi:hypothetical protein
LAVKHEVNDMPAVSKKQQKLMAIAEHDPEAVSPENAGVTKMSHKQLHDYAATKTEGLPAKVKTHSRTETKRGYASDKKYQHDTGRHMSGRGKTMR